MLFRSEHQECAEQVEKNRASEAQVQRELADLGRREAQISQDKEQLVHARRELADTLTAAQVHVQQQSMRVQSVEGQAQQPDRLAIARREQVNFPLATRS